MPSVLTGANLANRDLIYLGVSGDGDSPPSASASSPHCMRRGVNMVYIVENNGVYGLTKGQFSATADKGSKSKRGAVNRRPVDLVGMALQLGATFVARSFSGDKEQLVPLIKAAMSTAAPPSSTCISPCVAFNNHAGSTKSYDYVREHNEAVNRLDVMDCRARKSRPTIAPGSRPAGLRPARAPEHSRAAAQQLRCRRTVPRQQGAGRAQRQPALNRSR
jgi:2-oxoglutarate ferredoxin oxidoreductase subunit beta